MVSVDSVEFELPLGRLYVFRVVGKIKDDRFDLGRCRNDLAVVFKLQ